MSDGMGVVLQKECCEMRGDCDVGMFKYYKVIVCVFCNKWRT